MSGHAAFSFSFSGDDIDESIVFDAKHDAVEPIPMPSAFPVAGRPSLPAQRHHVKQMLSQLPSKIAFSTLHLDLGAGAAIQLPRRELWDVRLQLMAEEEEEGEGDREDCGGETQPGLGNYDVKTGIYEGGFKSWESSVDLVKVLWQPQFQSFLVSRDGTCPFVMELGCGTALPSLALFQWASSCRSSEEKTRLSFLLADYNATVLQLVALPNLILSWALQSTDPALVTALSTSDGELELSADVIQAFEHFLSTRKIDLHFLSGGWSPDFVRLVAASTALKQRALILGAETIYSPAALSSFTETIVAIMQQQKMQGNSAEVLVGAKKMYFGVGGSLDDFVAKARGLGAVVEPVREEVKGVRRGVVHCVLPP